MHQQATRTKGIGRGHAPAIAAGFGGKTFVVVPSTMRSGSTLLKALLAEADDVSNLPEINFQRFRNPVRAARKIARLDPRPIIVLKRPAWFHETATYPRLPPVAPLKAIVLVRDAYPTVLSVRRMLLGRLASWLGRVANGLLVDRYWAPVTERLLAVAESLGDDARLVRYEDLAREPSRVTRELFAFMGSRCERGVDSYRAPEDFDWTWGTDDASDRIKSLVVQPPRPCRYDDRHLRRTIERSERVSALRRRLAYPPVPSADRAEPCARP